MRRGITNWLFNEDKYVETWHLIETDTIPFSVEYDLEMHHE